MLVVLVIVFTEKDKEIVTGGKRKTIGTVTASPSSGHLNSLVVLGKEKAVLCMNKSMMNEHVQIITAVCDKCVGNNQLCPSNNLYSKTCYRQCSEQQGVHQQIRRIMCNSHLVTSKNTEKLVIQVTMKQVPEWSVSL